MPLSSSVRRRTRYESIGTLKLSLVFTNCDKLSRLTLSVEPDTTSTVNCFVCGGLGGDVNVSEDGSDTEGVVADVTKLLNTA